MNTLQDAKSKIRIPLVSLLILLLVFTSACDPGAVRQVGARVALRGQESCDAALEVYSKVDAAADTDKMQQDLITVLTRPAQSKLPLPDKPRVSFEAQLGPRIKAYKALRKAYATLHRLSDPAFSDQTKEAADALTASINALRGVPDLPAPVSALLPTLAGFVVGQIQAKEIKKHNLALYHLAQAYNSLWENDKPIWERHIARVHTDYSAAIESLTPEQFDEARLRDTVKEPFGKPYLVSLYKLRKRDESRARQQELQTGLDEVSRAFATLARAHKELASQKPSLADVLSMLESISASIK
jgi:hypothetical protein